MRGVFNYIYLGVIHVFAAVGLLFIAVFFAVNLKLTDVSGHVDSSDEQFAHQAASMGAGNEFGTEEALWQGGSPSEASMSAYRAATDSARNSSSSAVTADVSDIAAQIEALHIKKNLQINQLCQLATYGKRAPKNVAKIITVKQATNSPRLMNQMLFAVRTKIPDVGALDQDIALCQNQFDVLRLTEASIASQSAAAATDDVFTWANTNEWQNAQTSILKDTDKIRHAAAVAKISPRIIVSNLMVEQLRLYFSQRELYKKYFEPLKILANAYHISLGVMSIKAETGKQIEQHLKDPQSPYYLGKEYEHLLDYPANADVDSQRFNRLSNDDHSWNYLYGALYLRQLLVQWQRGGYDLTNRPEIVGTLFNVGFAQSSPNPHPKVGGSSVKIGETTYSFGRLAFEFYYSGELEKEFPLTEKMYW